MFFICEQLLSDSTSILKNAYKSNLIQYSVSGSSSQRINGSVVKTKPEYAFDQVEKKYDWCSNCPTNYKEHPYIVLSVKQKVMRLQGYFLRAGCCGTSLERCCCLENYRYCCRCCLYSWSFQISNDNSTWTTVHKIEKDREMEFCNEKTYKFSQEYSAKYVRLIQDEACPGDFPCLALNKIELIGKYEGGGDLEDEYLQMDTDEDDVSIIGHISKNIK